MVKTEGQHTGESRESKREDREQKEWVKAATKKFARRLDKAPNAIEPR